MKPYYERDGIVLYLGDCREVSPTLTERGIVMFDAPYSAWVHKNAKSNARRGGETMIDGAGRLPACSVIRRVDLGFECLSDELLAHLSKESARLAARWVASFSDVESCHLWRASFVATGLEYVRTAAWRKIGSTPQFTGDRPAVAFETITIAHPKGRKRWNGGGRHGWWDIPDDIDRDDLDAYDADLVYAAPIIVERGGKDGISADREPRIHKTQKPEKLMLDLVADFSDEGETIYDFTAGGATTLVCAWRLKRRATGIEIREDAAEKAAKRIDRAISQIGYYQPERDAARGQRNLFG